VDKQQRYWREQEQILVERWTAAEGRYRAAQAAMAQQTASQDKPTPDSLQAIETARIELEAVRKQVARLKAEFSAGKRY